MDRYSFTGTGNVLLKAAFAGTYGGKSYLAGEPIAYFSKVVIDVSFSNSEKIAKQGISNLASDSKSEASFLRVSNIAVNDSLQSLLYKKQLQNTRNRIISTSVRSINNSLYLPIKIGEILIGDLFIYNSNKTLITVYTLDINTGEITGLLDGIYSVFYSVTKIADITYFLETPSMPNISVQIEVEGNLNGITGIMNIHFNAVKLITRPTLDFSSSTPFVDSLEFAIINSKDGVEVNYYA